MRVARNDVDSAVDPDIDPVHWFVGLSHAVFLPSNVRYQVNSISGWTAETESEADIVRRADTNGS